MFFVLDEADSLLSQSHKPLIFKIYEMLPKSGIGNRRMQMIVCSATLHSPEVKQLSEKIMCFPTWVDLKGVDSVPETVHHTCVRVNPKTDKNMLIDLAPESITSVLKLQPRVITDGVHEKDNLNKSLGNVFSMKTPGNELLSEVVKLVKPFYLKRVIDAHQMDQALIFVRTRLDANHLEVFLKSLGGGSDMVNEYSCACLHGSKGPQRAQNLTKFKDGEIRFLICTDVAGRGIDISGLPYVINMTLPDNVEDYIHRVGRVGRQDRMGLAISIVSEIPEKVWYHTCPSRGTNCSNSKLKSLGGCAIWYEEKSVFDEIKSRIGDAIPVLNEQNFKAEMNEREGKIIYGEPRKSPSTAYENHVNILAPSAKELAELEYQAQSSYLKLKFSPWNADKLTVTGGSISSGIQRMKRKRNVIANCHLDKSSIRGNSSTRGTEAKALPFS